MSFDSGDEVLIDGTDKQVWSYASDRKHAVIVDHREEEDDMLAAFAKQLPARSLSYDCDYDAEKLSLTFEGKTSVTPLTISPKDRYIVIRALNKLLEPKYEIRAFRQTLVSDTHSFLVRPKMWWEEMDRAFASRMHHVFAGLDEGMDFT